MKTKSVIIIGAVALALLIVAFGLLLAQDYQAEPDYVTRITNGQKCYEQGQYDLAILEYLSALKLDDTSEDAYIGLASVYRTRGTPDLAYETLIKGMQKSGANGRIIAQLAIYFPEQPPEPGTERKAAVEENRKSGDIALDVELLDFLSSASYADYQRRFSDLKHEMVNDRCVIRTGSLDADVIYYNDGINRVINAAEGEPYAEFLPNEIVFDNITSLFGGADVIPYETIRMMSDIQNLTKNGNYLEFTSHGCKIKVACDEDGAISKGAENLLKPKGSMWLIGANGVYTLVGSVKDATTGETVGDVTMRFYEGDETGNYTEITTDYAGNYRLGVTKSGSYTVLISKPGYISETYQVYVPTSGGETRNDFTLSPEMDEGEIRIVLTWGASPADLDSHLSGKSSDGTSLWVYYAVKTAYNASGKVIAELDIDNRAGYGPETTTIYDSNGSYYFDVTDFTRTSGVGGSGATVKIYRGNTLIQTVVPDSNIGLGWRVCKIENGTVTVLNQSIRTSEGLPVL